MKNTFSVELKIFLAAALAMLALATAVVVKQVFTIALTLKNTIKLIVPTFSPQNDKNHNIIVKPA